MYHATLRCKPLKMFDIPMEINPESDTNFEYGLTKYEWTLMKFNGAVTGIASFFCMFCNKYTCDVHLRFHWDDVFDCLIICHDCCKKYDNNFDSLHKTKQYGAIILYSFKSEYYLSESLYKICLQDDIKLIDIALTFGSECILCDKLINTDLSDDRRMMLIFKDNYKEQFYWICTYCYRRMGHTNNDILNSLIHINILNKKIRVSIDRWPIFLDDNEEDLFPLCPSVRDFLFDKSSLYLNERKYIKETNKNDFSFLRYGDYFMNNKFIYNIIKLQDSEPIRYNKSYSGKIIQTNFEAKELKDKIFKFIQPLFQNIHDTLIYLTSIYDEIDDKYGRTLTLRNAICTEIIKN